VHVKIGRLIVRLREIQRDLYTFYTRVYCEFIVIVENICSAEGTFSTASILLKEMRYLVYIRYLWLYI
jgi:hypothetical protein